MALREAVEALYAKMPNTPKETARATPAIWKLMSTAAAKPDFEHEQVRLLCPDMMYRSVWPLRGFPAC